jgi:signal transduction histidine kinase/CheY-like chemotaxis protein
VGNTPFIVPNAAHEMTFYDDLWSTIKDGRVWQGNLISIKKDGSSFTALTTITPVKDDIGKIVNYVSTQVDVTREQELEKQYRQAQKMEAIGQLTAGIAHDFNNLLMAINGFAELMKFRLPKESPFQDMASRIVASGESAANLIRQLLIFSRKQIVEPQVINLNETVTEIDKMLRRIIGENIDLQTDLAPGLWPTKLDSSQLEQIIVNLAINARDAMPTGGLLALETSNVQIKHQTSDLLGLEPGDYVVLTVVDSGIGMDEETKSHIFEPFFTTKEHGKGTGLGLATVYGIVRQNYGDIKVYSKPGEGSTFEVYLPRATEISATNPSEMPASTMSLGSETVLLVEDSSAVRELVTLTLSAQGYNIVKASNGEEALSLFKNYDGRIDLLLTDIVMPHMGGKELADRIIELDPAIKVIFTSGYTDEAISHYGMLDPEITFLQKPFSPGALVAKVREVLDAT